LVLALSSEKLNLERYQEAGTVHTILGAGGAIANELVKELARRGERIRLVSRNPMLVGSLAEMVTADLSDLTQTIHAVSASAVGVLACGPEVRPSGMAGVMASNYGQRYRGM
jgi:putative NADH-flavin reductase